MLPHLRQNSAGILGGVAWAQEATFEGGALTPGPLGADSSSGTDLSALEAAAIRGSWGMRVSIADNSIRYVQLEGPNAETAVIVEAWIDFNSLVTADGDIFSFLLSRGAAGNAFYVEYRNFSGTPRLVTSCINNSGVPQQVGENYGGNMAVPHLYRWEWISHATTGYMLMFIDNSLFSSNTGVTNSLRSIDEIRIGCTGGLDAGTSGAFDVDNFRWR